MKSSSLILMGIAVVAVGMFALPSTVSLFSGQHTWYAIHGENELPCRKCHAEVFDELQNSAFHKWDGYNWSQNPSSEGPDNSACYGCHRANKSITYASVGNSVTDVIPGTKAHAASTVACMLCHQFNADQAVNTFEGKTMPGYAAGGFADPANSSYNYTNTSCTGGHAAHQKFIQMAINKSLMEDANEACIACHTHVPVKINWTHRVSLEFNCTPEFELPPTHFNVSNWNVNGTANVTVYGNTTGFGATNSSAWPGKNPNNYTTGGYT